MIELFVMHMYMYKLMSLLTTQKILINYTVIHHFLFMKILNKDLI